MVGHRGRVGGGDTIKAKGRRARVPSLHPGAPQASQRVRMGFDGDNSLSKYTHGWPFLLSHSAFSNARYISPKDECFSLLFPLALSFFFLGKQFAPF